MLAESSVLVFGLGGVGSFAVEALARAGVGKIGICDFDTVEDTNRNRQLYALVSTVGKLKVDVAADRLYDINPEIKIEKFPVFYGPDSEIALDSFDYVVDAIDNVTAKILLAKKAPNLISCMGTGNKLDSSQLKIADIYETSACPLARVMRRELRACGIEKLTVLYSTEPPLFAAASISTAAKAAVPASISFVPPVAGMMLAGYVVRQLIGL